MDSEKNKDTEKNKDSKKKLVVALLLLIFVSAGLLVSLVGVLAAFKTNGEGGYNIQYTAKNVKATISAEYKVGTGAYNTIMCDGENLMTFTGEEESEEISKTFDSITKTDLAYDEDIIIHYTITNTGTEAFSITSATAFTNTNFNVTYATSETAETWSSTIAEVGTIDSVGAGESVNLYVKISIATKTKDATLTGNTSFTLDLI